MREFIRDEIADVYAMADLVIGRAGAGTVLAMWRGGRDALDMIGVGERVRSSSLPADRVALRGPGGAVLHARGVPTLWFAPRPDLVAALEAAVPEAVTRLTRDQVRAIAEAKMPDLNANDLDAAEKIIAGTARQVGITVEGHG